jgi:hypothetical protein
MFSDLEGEKARADAMLAERADAFGRDIREARIDEQRIRLRLGREGQGLAEAAAATLDKASQLEAGLTYERVAANRPDEALIVEIKDELTADADRFLENALALTRAVLHSDPSG